MEWFKKHTDTVAVITAILGAMVWMNGKFNQVEIRLVKIETVLMMKGLMSTDMVATECKRMQKDDTASKSLPKS